MPRRLGPLFFLLTAVTLAGGCAHSQASRPYPGCPDSENDALAGPKVADTSNQPRVKVVNTYCPVAGTHVVGEGKTTVASLTRDYKGKKIGFCCDSCPPAWDGMSDDEKKAAFDAAMAREAKPADKK